MDVFSHQWREIGERCQYGGCCVTRIDTSRSLRDGGAQQVDWFLIAPIHNRVAEHTHRQVIRCHEQLALVGSDCRDASRQVLADLDRCTVSDHEYLGVAKYS